MFLVLGGAGFIGSNFVRYLVSKGKEIVVYDKFTYAGRIENLQYLDVEVVRGDIVNEEFLDYVVKRFELSVVVNFAAETHVDRSINEPSPFVRTNVLGVFSVLEVCRKYDVRLVHISTDEVYGDILEGSFSEDSCLNPSSPYSACKACGDLLIKSYVRTYGLESIIVRPCNNYGPYQFPEKFIPKTILRALHDKPIPVYGDGSQVRDWLYIEDFCNALYTIISKGAWGTVYNVPGFNEKKNIDVVRDILSLLGKPESLIRFVADRPGHDKRYSMTGDRVLSLGWRPKTGWLEGLKKTIVWYKNNGWWWRPLVGDRFFVSDMPW